MRGRPTGGGCVLGVLAGSNGRCIDESGIHEVGMPAESESLRRRSRGVGAASPGVAPRTRAFSATRVRWRRRAAQLGGSAPRGSSARSARRGRRACRTCTGGGLRRRGRGADDESAVLAEEVGAADRLAPAGLALDVEEGEALLGSLPGAGAIPMSRTVVAEGAETISSPGRAMATCPARPAPASRRGASARTRASSSSFGTGRGPTG